MTWFQETRLVSLFIFIANFRPQKEPIKPKLRFFSGTWNIPARSTRSRFLWWAGPPSWESSGTTTFATWRAAAERWETRPTPSQRWVTRFCDKFYLVEFVQKLVTLKVRPSLRVQQSTASRQMGRIKGKKKLTRPRLNGSAKYYYQIDVIEGGLRIIT